jgi:hypothetical protein
MKRVLPLIFLLLSSLCLLECSKPQCPPPEDLALALCQNGVRDAGETGIDCGGTCATICSLKTIVLQPGAEGIDAYIASINPNSNSSGYSNVVEDWTDQGSPFTSMVYFAFNYDAIPSAANIQSASLTLYADTTNDFHPGVSVPKGHSQYSASNEWLLKKVTAPWDESLITWNNRPAVDDASVIDLAASTARDQSYTIDLTNFVKNEFASGNYYGFRMEMKTKTTYNAIIFYSSDGPYPTLRPKMVIQYY